MKSQPSKQASNKSPRLAKRASISPSVATVVRIVSANSATRRSVVATSAPKVTACAAASATDVIGRRRRENWLLGVAEPSLHPGRKLASPSNTQGGSRVRELRPLGSVRGAGGDTRIYRVFPIPPINASNPNDVERYKWRHLVESAWSAPASGDRFEDGGKEQAACILLLSSALKKLVEIFWFRQCSKVDRVIVATGRVFSALSRIFSKP